MSRFSTLILVLVAALGAAGCDVDLDGIYDVVDNCIVIFNPGQEDQDLDGEGDICDASTYDFEQDGLNQRPIDVTQEGADELSFYVRDFSGDRGVRYDGGTIGVHDVFDRLPAPGARRDYDLYLDSVDTPGETLAVELWSDGTAVENAGSGVEVRIAADGRIEARLRTGQFFTELGDVVFSPNDRLRIRARKDAGTTTRLSVDSWNGTDWVQRTELVLDDSTLFGRNVAITQQEGGRRPLTRITGSAVVPGDVLTLDTSHDTLEDWKLFQRGPAGHAPIPVPFTYQSVDPVVLQVRLVNSTTGALVSGFGFSDMFWSLEAAPSGASSTVILPDVPQGGNYDLEARLLQAFTSAVLGEDTVVSIAVGDVFLTAGQSNMAGASGTLGTPETPSDDVHLFGNDYTWKIGEEPMDNALNQSDLISRDGKAEHSLMLRFAKEVSAATGVPVAIIPGPVGGSSVFGWQRTEDATNRATLYGSALHRVAVQGYAHPIRGVLWWQGETDFGNSTGLYRAILEDIVASFRDDLGANLFFGSCQLTTYALADLDLWLAIQEAQRQQAAADTGTSPGGTAIVGTVDQPHVDDFHLTSEAYKAMGVRLARATLSQSYGLSQPLGPQLVSISSTGASAIDVAYDKSLEVTSGIDATLWRVQDDNGDATITSATVIGSTMRLQLATVPSGAVLVSYGYSTLPAANWLRSSDGAGVALAFQDVPLETTPIGSFRKKHNEEIGFDSRSDGVDMGVGGR